jgi:flagellar hook-associated protein 2
MTTAATSSVNVGFAFNVSEVVETLLVSKRGPLNRIESDIQKSNLAISAMGVFRSKLSAFKDAALALQDASAFRSLSSSDTTVATATAGSGAQSGVYSLAVKSIAQVETWELSGFSASSAAAAEALSLGTNSLQVSYSSSNVLGDGKTLGEFVTAINSSALPFTAEIVNKGPGAGGNNVYSLVIRADTLGNASDLNFTGSVTMGLSTLNPSELQDGQDAVFAVNGVEYTRITNQISDVVSGLTFSLTGKADSSVSYKTGSAVTSITVGTGAVSTVRAAFQGFIDAYNDLAAFYADASKATSSSASTDAGYEGSLAGNLAARSVMEEIRSRFFAGNLQADGVTALSFFSAGLAFSGSVLGFRESQWESAVAAGLADKVASGLTLGKKSTDSESLVDILSAAISSDSSVIDEFVSNETFNRLPTLEQRKGRAEQSLELLRLMYVRQYSNLNAQLAKLDSISQSVSAMLAGLKLNSN